VASLGGEGSSSGLYVTPLSAASFVRKLEVIASRLPTNQMADCRWSMMAGKYLRCLDGEQESWPDVLTGRRVGEVVR
jgi:hypothetical protein